jgi:hypothetical protein
MRPVAASEGCSRKDGVCLVKLWQHVSFVMDYLDGGSSVHKHASSAAGTVSNSSDAREGCISRALHGHGSSIGPTITREVGATHLQHVA